MRRFKFYPHQLEAIKNLRTGSILHGGVGSGKSLTALGYYYIVECGGEYSPKHQTPMKNPKDLYVITTARKRDSFDWQDEAVKFLISSDPEVSFNGVKITVDSWNKIKNYIDVKDAFFIFDEQRVIGSGAWVKSFLKIAKQNNWILLSATPGDTWLDYIPVFIANGFYRNRTEFLRTHVVFTRFAKFPQIERFIGIDHLEKLKRKILVQMDYVRPTNIKKTNIWVDYDFEAYRVITQKRWDVEKEEPFRTISGVYFAARKLVNSHPSRLHELRKLIEKHRKVIVFYTFNYELDILRTLKEDDELDVKEYNGHKHEDIPSSEKWAYLVQYTSGSEAWNCTVTNVIVFYSLNYSYRLMTQAAGRIDRMNTPFQTLYYYNLVSKSTVDRAIRKALIQKKDFNESDYDLAPKSYAIIEGESIA